MIIHLIMSVIAFILTSAAMPLVIAVSRRYGALSDIGGRHIGVTRIGRLGGFGVLIGIFLSISIAYLASDAVRNIIRDGSTQHIGLLIGLIIVAIAGFWDDLRRLPAHWKFLLQTIAALVAYCYNLRISAIDLPFFAPINLGFLALPLTVIWIVGIVNAVNLIDGLDGLAGGVLLFAAIVNLAAAIVSGAIATGILMATLSGGVLGFLLFNWYPARIYLGDGGAYSLGFVIATSCLLSPNQKISTSVALLVPILAMGLPIFDTIVAIIRRWLDRRGIFSPDRGHLHHILLDSGIGHRTVVIGLYSISSVFASVAIIIIFNRSPLTGVFIFVSAVCGFFIWGVHVREKLFQIGEKFLHRWRGK